MYKNNYKIANACVNDPWIKKLTGPVKSLLFLIVAAFKISIDKSQLQQLKLLAKLFDLSKYFQSFIQGKKL